MSNFEYVNQHYNIRACFGRIVEVDGKRGVIAEDRGNYIGVNFDDNKAGVISNCHPTWNVDYFGIGRVRPLTRSQKRYKLYMEYGDMFECFLDFLNSELLAEIECRTTRGGDV
ncbi:MAG: hypothetical protein ABNH21_06805 [Glaciecola sp.]